VLDVLSEVLKDVTLKGAVFYNAEFSAPWSFRSPASHVIAPHLGPDAGHVIIYHLVAEGGAWAQIEKGPRIDLGPGDIVVFPHGDPHLMGNGRPTEPVDHGKELGRILSQGLEIARMGGGGEITKFVCGYMVCEPQVSRLLLAGLPPLLKVNIRNDPSGVWLEHSIRFSVANAGSPTAGAGAVLAKLSEALFVETLRRYIALLPPAQTGWLAGARDPEVGKALGLLHRQPARPWTIADLAASVGVSRAVLAERFQHYLGEPPIGYLTRWRLQLGARLLTTTSHGVAQIAAQVGYDSEAAFNRAFKRNFGAPPARFRRNSRSATAKSEGAAAAG
jgi:AraC-like DNA-binding protein